MTRQEELKITIKALLVEDSDPVVTLERCAIAGRLLVEQMRLRAEMRPTLTTREEVDAFYNQMNEEILFVAFDVAGKFKKHLGEIPSGVTRCVQVMTSLQFGMIRADRKALGAGVGARA